MRNVLRALCVLAFALSPIVSDAAVVKKAASKAAKTAVKATKKTATTAAATVARPAGPRRLEDIQIEGEVPVPQVLFITARDQRRFLESHHDLYLRTSRELGESTPLPARVVLTPAGSSATPASPGATPAPGTTPVPAPVTPTKGDGR